jgi:PAS domain S-box-containing protein
MASRVLVIDDNRDLASTIAEILEGALAVKAVCCKDARSGLSAALDAGFDVAIVDVKLPDGSGVDLIGPLRRASPGGEVLVVTGHATVDTAISALKAGASAFLLKSFHPEELIRVVDQALEKVALRQERELLERRQRALVEDADVLIVGMSSAGVVCLWNPRAADATGVPAGAAIGHAFTEGFVPAADRPRMQSAIEDAVGSGRSVEVEAGLSGPAGTLGRVRWHLSKVRGDDLLYGIGIDVTERRALERRASDAEALSMMGSLALGLAHEIRNPLNAAVLQLRLLTREIQRTENAAQASMKSRVEIVEAEIGRLGRMLNDFLELARPREIKKETVDVAQLADNVIALAADALGRQKIVLSADVEAGATAVGDPEKLRVVLQNLVANALDAMPEGGRLSLVVRAAKNMLTIEVDDTGAGIDPTIVKEIFEPFFTTKEAGTGLGLSIVRKIVDQHGGKIEIDSAKTNGTRVKVELPR